MDVIEFKKLYDSSVCNLARYLDCCIRMELEKAIKDSLANLPQQTEKTATKKPASSATKVKKSDASTSNSSRSQTKRQKSSSSTSYTVRRQKH